jgi:hypothetical protein
MRSSTKTNLNMNRSHLVPSKLIGVSSARAMQHQTPFNCAKPVNERLFTTAWWIVSHATSVLKGPLV